MLWLVKPRRAVKLLFASFYFMEEKEVGFRGKALGRHPQMPKYPLRSKAQERVNFQLC